MATFHLRLASMTSELVFSIWTSFHASFLSVSDKRFSSAWARPDRNFDFQRTASKQILVHCNWWYYSSLYTHVFLYYNSRLISCKVKTVGTMESGPITIWGSHYHLCYISVCAHTTTHTNTTTHVCVFTHTVISSHLFFFPPISNTKVKGFGSTYKKKRFLSEQAIGPGSFERVIIVKCQVNSEGLGSSNWEQISPDGDIFNTVLSGQSEAAGINQIPSLICLLTERSVSAHCFSFKMCFFPFPFLPLSLSLFFIYSSLLQQIRTLLSVN